MSTARRDGNFKSRLAAESASAKLRMQGQCERVKPRGGGVYVEWKEYLTTMRKVRAGMEDSLVVLPAAPSFYAAQLDLLRRLDVPPRLSAGTGAGVRGQVGLQLQGVPAAAEAGQFQRR